MLRIKKELFLNGLEIQEALYVPHNALFAEQIEDYVMPDADIYVRRLAYIIKICTGTSV